MPKSINEKEVRARIKNNTAIMKESKKKLIDMMNEAVKNVSVNSEFAKESRTALTAFVNAIRAIEKDTAKLPAKVATTKGE